MKIITSLLFLFISLIGFAQTDSTAFHSELGLMGRRQTGTLDQLGLNPSLRISLGSDKLSLESAASYQLLKINDFKAVNDLWINDVVRVASNKKVFPMAIAYYGYADSYRIDHSLVAGAGIGVNVLKKSPGKFLQVHIFGGHYEVDYLDDISLASPMVGSFTKAVFPLDKGKLNLVWEFHSYHSLDKKDFNGASNSIQLRYHLFKGFNLNISHNTIYNQTVGDGIAKTNTIMMFGFMHTLNKKF